MININGSGERLVNVIHDTFNIDLRQIKDIEELQQKLLTINNTPKGIRSPLKPPMNFPTSNQVGAIADKLGIAKYGFRTDKEVGIEVSKIELAERRREKHREMGIHYKDYFITRQFKMLSVEREYYLRQPKGFTKKQMVDVRTGKILGWY